MLHSMVICSENDGLGCHRWQILQPAQLSRWKFLPTPAKDVLTAKPRRTDRRSLVAPIAKRSSHRPRSAFAPTGEAAITPTAKPPRTDREAPSHRPRSAFAPTGQAA